MSAVPGQGRARVPARAAARNAPRRSPPRLARGRPPPFAAPPRGRLALAIHRPPGIIARAGRRDPRRPAPLRSGASAPPRGALRRWMAWTSRAGRPPAGRRRSSRALGMLAGKLQICIVLEGGRAGFGIRRSGSTRERSRREEGRVLGTPANNLQRCTVFGGRRAGFGMVNSWSPPERSGPGEGRARMQRTPLHRFARRRAGFRVVHSWSPSEPWRRGGRVEARRVIARIAPCFAAEARFRHVDSASAHERSLAEGGRWHAASEPAVASFRSQLRPAQAYVLPHAARENREGQRL